MAGSDQDSSTVPAANAPAGVVVREGDYGERVITVEPGGAEFIPLDERHGRPLQLFWTWTSPTWSSPRSSSACLPLPCSG